MQSVMLRVSFEGDVRVLGLIAFERILSLKHNVPPLRRYVLTQLRKYERATDRTCANLADGLSVDQFAAVLL